jgi:hypothetical protein
MNTLERDHNIVPGTLFVMKDFKNFYNTKNGEIDDFHYTTRGKVEYAIVKEKECIMFLGVTYDPWQRQHYFRFLFDNKIVVIPFQKGKTIRMLKTTFDIKSNTNIDDKTNRQIVNGTAQ